MVEDMGVRGVTLLLCRSEREAKWVGPSKPWSVPEGSSKRKKRIKRPRPSAVAALLYSSRGEPWGAGIERAQKNPQFEHDYLPPPKLGPFRVSPFLHPFPPAIRQTAGARGEG